MKKIYTIIILLLAVYASVNAQCTPDILCASLICPDTVTNLPDAEASVLYTTTMTVRVPADTVVPPFGTVTIDNLKYDSISGLPPEFSATPDSIAGWPGGSMGCLLITGTTTNAQAGTHSLIIYTTVKAMGGAITLPLTLTGYKITVDSASGISDINLIKFTLDQNSPNPYSKTTTIVFTSPNSEKYNFSIINVIGEEVYSKSINAVTGKNSFEFSASALPSGIYMYKLGNKTSTITKRMIIEK